MAKSRLRQNRAAYKQSNAKHYGWSKGKTAAIVIIMTVIVVFIIAVFVALFMMR